MFVIMRSESGVIDHQCSRLLTRDENEQVFRLLGNRCQSLATGVVQLFITDPPDHSSWRRSDAGVLCLVKDNQRRSYFFRLYCLSRNQMVWEHEVYNSMDYKSPKAWLHTFEGEDYIVAFNFASEEDAKTIKNVLNEKLEAKKQRRLERRSRSSMQPRPGSGTNVSGSHMGNTNVMANGSVVPAARQQHRVTPSGKKKDKDSKRRLTKADIGPPKDFRHVSHVGWDPNKGFDVDNVEDPQLKLFFDKILKSILRDINQAEEVNNDKPIYEPILTDIMYLKDSRLLLAFYLAGVSDSQLQDRETREFIYDFINRHGGIDAVKDSVIHPQISQPPLGPPPVPARTAPVVTSSSNFQYQTRTAPPPPPSRTNALPPPPPPVQHPIAPGPPPPPPPTRTPPQRQDIPAPGAPAPPPMPPASVCAPPPPPPPMSMPAAEADGHPEPPSGANDSRSALMESIRCGKALKHVEVDKRPSIVSDSRGELLEKIRQGVELKSVQPTPRPPINTAPQDSLAGALARALAERSRVIHSDTSGSSDADDEEDDEWED